MIPSQFLEVHCPSAVGQNWYAEMEDDHTHKYEGESKAGWKKNRENVNIFSSLT